jgi:uncharacterized membrane protein
MHYSKIIKIAIVYALFAFSPHGTHAAQTCHTIESTATTPTGYGAPVSFFSSTQNTLVNVSCSDTQATVTVGNGQSNQYIYKYGYELVNITWRQISLTGENNSGLWFRGTAHTVLTRSSETMLQKNRIIVYTCTKVDGSWKCGCKDKECARPHWTVQEFQTKSLNNDSTVVIDRIEPNTLEEGDVVTIYGTGFDALNNSVFTPYFKALKVPSTENGTRLTFTFEPKFTVFSLSELDSQIDEEDTDEFSDEDDDDLDDTGYDDPTKKHSIPLPVVVQTPSGKKDMLVVTFLQNLFTE